MYQEIAQALKNQDLAQAIALIKKFRHRDGENPWLDFYTARLQEIKGKTKQAKNAYIEQLKNALNPKLMSQIRQGIERINQQEKQKKEEELAKAKAQEGAEEMGLFILQNIPKEDKQIASQNFAKVMEIDPYTARLQIPSRSWRLYRIGKLGELSYYINKLNAVNIPCFAVPIKTINQLNIYQVKYIEQMAPQLIVICENKAGEEENLSFDLTEVKQRVEGLVPLFENSFKFDQKWQIYHKKEILDYAQFCDLHLGKQKIILRICDQTYKFDQGIKVVNFNQGKNLLDQDSTIRKKWSNFLQFLDQELAPIPKWQEFNFFGETVLDFKEFLTEIDSHIVLFDQEMMFWDKAFHLYSSLVFLRLLLSPS